MTCRVSRHLVKGESCGVAVFPLERKGSMKIDFGKEVDVKFLNRREPVKMEGLDCDRVVFLPDQRVLLANINGIGRVVIASKENFDVLFAGVLSAVTVEVKKQADAGNFQQYLRS